MNSLPSTRVTIETVGHLRAAIKRAKRICVQARFGTSESWIKISKVQALELIEGANDRQRASDFEMPTGDFGMIDQFGTLYLG
jgi:hypothetical protein